MFNAQDKIDQLESLLEKRTAENAQLRCDVDYLAAERGIERKRAEKLEEQMATIRELYEAEADTANDLALEVARLNKVIKKKEKT